jgi:hypothetical protein
LRRQIPSRTTNDAGRYARLRVPEKKAVRIADCDRPLANEQIRRIAKGRDRQTLGVDPDDCEVVGFISPEKLGRIRSAVPHRHGDARRVAHHVRVRQDYAIFADDESRPEPSRRSRTRAAAEELFENVGGHPLHDLRLNRHDTWRHTLDGRRDRRAPSGRNLLRLLRGKLSRLSRREPSVLARRDQRQQDKQREPSLHWSAAGRGLLLSELRNRSTPRSVRG